MNGVKVYVVDGARTPFLKARTEPGPFSASDLAVACARPVLARQPFKASQIDEVIVGCVIPAADEANIARLIALRLGCGKRVPAHTVQRNCASGLQAVASAAERIVLGRANLVLAGGTEAMSRAPIQWNNSMSGWLGKMLRARNTWQRLQALARFRPALLKPVYALLLGLTDPLVKLSMGQTAEILAHRFGISRESQDVYALNSHKRLAAAFDGGTMNTEVETLYDLRENFYTEDTGLRRDTDLDQLAKLRPVFDRKYGQVTSGNSSQVTDGAAMLLLASESAVKEHGLNVLGEWVDHEWAGVDPSQMGLGPVHATSKLLARRQMKMGDLQQMELNEAFAAQVLACQAAWDSAQYAREELGLSAPLGAMDPERLNPEGGAISNGHPVGASGARLVLHLLHALRQKGGGQGVATLCIGGGQGGAMLLRAEDKK
ncbi:MAG: acetyl-CoA C-acetyltransferase [Gammaproteobacteria bacterium]|nr:acetyl-CoA C-acetyltransferase [Gammaproteobacteria bacterium]MDH3370368.1 acetyl-CoA C-acetyltransferase [Gammaproteobacteria bacterium]MDH3405750.1 acetyl-CoA C-acetyltransferase [Gammaproteobacteria bacterium]MDH5486331.1 acetyl-CoA C-acetyltransferase [Gammaproteobacteria bacterium]